MIVRRTSLISLLAAVLLVVSFQTADAKNKTDDTPQAKNEITAKAPANYLALSRLHMPVLVDRNRSFRNLELEVWLLPVDEENLALARSQKKAIMAGLQEDFSNYDWEAFQDAKKGPDIAKKIVAATVERVSGAKLQDVLIKTLLLR
jgi:hypothetical protein